MYRSQSMDWSPNRLSPNTANLVLRKEKNIERLNVELRSEIEDKNELIEENTSLKNRIEELKKQLNVKRLENSRLTEDMDGLNHELESMRQVCAGNGKIFVEAARLKEDLDILRKSKEDLETENERTAIAFEKAEAKIKLQADVIKVLEEAKNVLEVDLFDQNTVMNELRNRCKNYELEIADLNEYNRTLNDQVSQLESKTINTSMPLDNVGSLAQEVELETMKERIVAMTSDISTIEAEQSKLLLERDNLSKEKMEYEKQSQELNEKLHTSLEENGVLRDQCDTMKKEIESFYEEKIALEKTIRQLFEEKIQIENQCDEVSEKFTALMEVNVSLQKECSDLRDDVEQLSVERLNLEATVIDLKSGRIEFEKYSAKLNQELATLLAEKLALQDECKDLREKISQLSEENLNLEASVIDQKSERLESERKFLEQFSAEKANWEKIVREFDSEKTELEKQAEELTQNLTTAMNDNIVLRKTCQDLEERVQQFSKAKLTLETTISELDSKTRKFEKHVTQLNEQLTASENRIYELLSQNGDLKVSVEQLFAEKQNLETITSKLTSEKTQLEEELSEKLAVLLREKATLEKEIRKRNKKIELLSKDKSNLELIVTESQSKIEKAEIEFQSLNEKLSQFEKELNEKLDISLRERAALEAKMEIQDEKIELLSKNKLDLELMVTQSQLKIKKAEAESQSLSEKLFQLDKDLNEKLATSLRERAAVEEELGNHNKKIKLLSKDKLDLELILTESQSRIMEAERESQSLNEKLSRLEEELAISLRERAALEKKVGNQDEMIEQLSKDKLNLELLVTESQSKIMEAEMEAHSLNEKLSQTEKELNEKLVISLKERAALEEEIKKQDEKIKQLSKDKLNLELVVTESQSKIMEAEIESQSLNEKLSFLSDENFELRQENENLNANVTRLTAKKLDLEKTVERLEFNLDKLEETKTSLFEENRSLLDGNKNLQSEVQSLQSRIDDSRQKLNSTIEECNSLLADKQSMESSLLSLSQELYSISRQLEIAIVENKNYEISISETKTALQEKTADLLLATSRCSEIEKERDHYESLLRSVEQELKIVQTTKNELQKEFMAARAFIEQSSNENARERFSLEEKIKTMTDEMNRDRSLFEKRSIENEELQARIAELSKLEEQHSKMQEDFEKSLNEKAVKLEEQEKKMNSLVEKANLMSKENSSLEDSLKKLKNENVKLKTKAEELFKEKEGLYKIQKINDGAFQVQLESVSSKNATLSSENEKLLQLSESLQRDYDVVKKELDQVEKKLQCVEQVRVEELEKIVAQGEEERAQLDRRIRESQKKEEQLLHQVQTLNIKLVEESDRANVLQRTHAAELQKRVEMIKLLENKLARDGERITELKSKLEEAVESNELLTDEVKSRTNDIEMLEKENENLLVKIDDLETIKTDLRDACDRLKVEKDGLKKEQITLSLKVDKMDEALADKEKDIDRLRDEYEIFKGEYRKLVQHKDELESEFKDTLLQENNKLSKKCDELSEANTKMCEHLNEKDKIIETLTTKIEDLETCSNRNGVLETDLNETHVVASGNENEIYLNLRRENLRMADERDSYRRRQLELEAELEKEKESYRAKGLKLHEKIGNTIRVEYEGKLERAKTEYQRKLSERYAAREQEWQKKIDEYKTMLGKEKEHNKDLNSQNWNIMDQYLRLKQVNDDRRGSSTFSDNFLSPSTLRKTKSATHLNMLGGRGMGLAESDRRMSSMSSVSGRLSSFVPETDRRLSTVSTVSEDFAVPARKKPSTISAKVFPTEDEDQEIFDNACLADLKQGKMTSEEFQDFNKERLSTLQARNSLCPPHLKSSYPAETQFLPTKVLKEDEIKMGCPFDNDSEIETLSLGDRQRKPRHQTSYKKPGPPTPSKNGGRSTTVQVETPKNVLRESNDSGSTRRRSFTPKFFNNLFALRGHVNIPMSTRDNEENMPLTPKHTRLTSFRQRFAKH